MLKKIGQSGGASGWRVCYQRGLPRLVFTLLDKKREDYEAQTYHRDNTEHIPE